LIKLPGIFIHSLINSFIHSDFISGFKKPTDSRNR
jgi:hypothetical protein